MCSPLSTELPSDPDLPSVLKPQYNTWRGVHSTFHCRQTSLGCFARPKRANLYFPRLALQHVSCGTEAPGLANNSLGTVVLAQPSSWPCRRGESEEKGNKG